ncbi:molybdenum cofactor guanylyltransferase [Halorussus limi]|uniref:Probable molybdenum cofactor guanylyltransferase n=1 Tax=Halorussus limi TaxID=2938695 RepID=A0A8U0HWT5_9EURY|nr:molybdenum cofactor guanylyltransferase [Halorussus limi]UPV75388.1 molybdenum cofactor guanylyltransferase [Halorussus limi]
MPAGVVLAGGRSTRFGEGDKAVADLAGVPMIRRVADRLAPVVDVLVVNCRADQREAVADALSGYDRPVRFATDPDPDEGPMAGIRTGLREVEATDAAYGFVAACDMPFLDPDLVAHLFERARGTDAAVPRPTEWFETTHAVYRATAMADACDAALAAGERRIVEPLFELDYVVVEGEELAQFDAASFANVNTREEFEDAERRLRE